MRTYLSHQRNQGSAITGVLIAVLVLATLVGVSTQVSSHQNRLAARQREMMKSVAAADGALEYAYAVWKDTVRVNGMRATTTTMLNSDQRIVDLKLTNNTTFSPAKELSATGNLFSGFSIASGDPWGVVDSSTTAVTSYAVAVDGYPGWKGSAYYYKASITATAPNTLWAAKPVSATVNRYFSMRTVPLFQAAIFYMDNLEIHPGALMTISGLVHTNKDLYASGYAKLQFLGNVSYSGNFAESAPNIGDWTGAGTGDAPTITPFWSDDKQSDTSTARPKQLNGPVSRIEPFGLKPEELFNTTDANLNNDGYHEWIEPPKTGSGQTDPTEIADQRLYNKAGLRIQIDSSKLVTDATRLTITDGVGGALLAADLTALTAAIDVSTTMYDWREGGGVSGAAAGNVKVTNIDVKKLNTALSGISGFNGVVYVNDINPANKSAIRLKNGAALAADLTIASSNPVYIQGDYNTGWGGTGTVHDPNYVPSNNGGNIGGTESPIVSGYTKKSAAVIADAVVVLSNNWNDANAGNTLGYRMATPTTVNAAIMAGDVPTNYNNNGRASGGAHNFPRFLEAWWNPATSQYVDFTYYGSMVQAFTSKTFTGAWETGNVYVWPNRKWNYETRFTTTPPPGTVSGTSFSRGRWERL